MKFAKLEIRGRTSQTSEQHVHYICFAWCFSTFILFVMLKFNTENYTTPSPPIVSVERYIFVSGLHFLFGLALAGSASCVTINEPGFLTSCNRSTMGARFGLSFFDS